MKTFAGELGTTSRRFTKFYVQPLWTANSEEQAFSLTVSAQGAGTYRVVHRVYAVDGASHTQGYREPFSQSPAAIRYDVGSLISMGRTGRLQVEVSLRSLTFPPQGRERKRKGDNKTRQEATAHAGTQRPPPTGRLRGAFRESTPRPGWACRTAHSSTLVAAMQTRGLVGQSRLQSHS